MILNRYLLTADSLLKTRWNDCCFIDSLLSFVYTLLDDFDVWYFLTAETSSSKPLSQDYLNSIYEELQAISEKLKVSIRLITISIIKFNLNLLLCHLLQSKFIQYVEVTCCHLVFIKFWSKNIFLDNDIWWKPWWHARKLNAKWEKSGKLLDIV